MNTTVFWNIENIPPPVREPVANDGARAVGVHRQRDRRGSRVLVRSSQARDDVGIDRQIGEHHPRAVGGQRRRTNHQARHRRRPRSTSGTHAVEPRASDHPLGHRFRRPRVLPRTGGDDARPRRSLTRHDRHRELRKLRLEIRDLALDRRFRRSPDSRPISIADVSANCCTLSDEVAEALMEHVGRDVRVEHARPRQREDADQHDRKRRRGRRTTGSACAARARAAGGGCARSSGRRATRSIRSARARRPCGRSRAAAAARRRAARGRARARARPTAAHSRPVGVRSRFSWRGGGVMPPAVASADELVGAERAVVERPSRLTRFGRLRIES